MLLIYLQKTQFFKLKIHTKISNSSNQSYPENLLHKATIHSIPIFKDRLTSYRCLCEFPHSLVFIIARKINRGMLSEYIVI